MNFPRRIVGDYDVDRVQVEAWQHVEPSTTNHPFGLIPVFWNQNDKRRANNGKSGPRQPIESENLHVDVRERAKPRRKPVCEK